MGFVRAMVALILVCSYAGCGSEPESPRDESGFAADTVARGQSPSENDLSESRPASLRGTVVLASFPKEVDPVNSTVMTQVDLENGTASPLDLSEFASGDAQFKLERIDGNFVFRGNTGTEVGTFVVDDSFDAPSRNLGESWYFVPSATDGRVWLVLHDPESPDTAPAVKGVREMTVDGDVTLADTGPPPGANLVGAVSQGLLIQEEELEVWDPVDDRIVLRLPGVFPSDTYGDLVAWCDYRCPQLHLTDVGSGTDVMVEEPTGFPFEETYNGSFSPDGGRLAVPVKGPGGLQVAVVDVEAGNAMVVPGSRLSVYQLITWNSSGDWLFFETGDGNLMAYNPLSGELVETPIDPAQTYFAIAAD